MRPPVLRAWAAAGVSLAGLACLVLLPWVESNGAYLHWTELAKSDVRYEAALAWAAAAGLALGFIPIAARRWRLAWAAACAGGILAASATARAAGFVLARRLDGEAALASLGPGALVPLLCGLAVLGLGLAGSRWPVRVAVATAGLGLAAGGLLPIGKAGPLHIDEWTAVLRWPSGPVARVVGWHAAASAALALTAALAAVALSPKLAAGPWRWAPVAAAAVACFLGVAEAWAWSRLPGSTPPTAALAVAGTALLLLLALNGPTPHLLRRRGRTSSQTPEPGDLT